MVCRSASGTVLPEAGVSDACDFPECESVCRSASGAVLSYSSDASDLSECESVCRSAGGTVLSEAGVSDACDFSECEFVRAVQYSERYFLKPSRACDSNKICLRQFDRLESGELSECESVPAVQPMEPYFLKPTLPTHEVPTRFA